MDALLKGALLLLCAWTLAMSPASAAPKTTASKPIPVEQIFTGVLNVGSFDPKLGQATVDASPLIISTEAAYDAFLHRIPKQQVSRTRPTPPNNDPLLKRPQIDFTKKVLVVVISADVGSQPRVLKVLSEAKQTTVLVAKAPPSLNAQPVDIGSYTAVVFRKPSQPIKIQYQ